MVCTLSSLESLRFYHCGMSSNRPGRSEAERHVVYEIEAMCRSAARYAEEWGSQVNLATPAGWEDAVFFLEASLLHARTLVMLFGYPKAAEFEILSALALPEGIRDAFRAAFSHPEIAVGEAYGQLSELVAHVGAARWDAPLGLGVQQPLELAYSVLNALDSSGATAASEAISETVESGRIRLTAAA